MRLPQKRKPVRFTSVVMSFSFRYLAALNAAWLNESATLFRRKYYHNGSHAGFIMYVTDTLPDGGYVDDIREAMKNSKGPGIGGESVRAQRAGAAAGQVPGNQ